MSDSTALPRGGRTDRDGAGAALMGRKLNHGLSFRPINRQGARAERSGTAGPGRLGGDPGRLWSPPRRPGADGVRKFAGELRGFAWRYGESGAGSVGETGPLSLRGNVCHRDGTVVGDPSQLRSALSPFAD